MSLEMIQIQLALEWYQWLQSLLDRYLSLKHLPRYATFGER